MVAAHLGRLNSILVMKQTVPVISCSLHNMQCRGIHLIHSGDQPSVKIEPRIRAFNDMEALRIRPLAKTGD